MVIRLKLKFIFANEPTSDDMPPFEERNYANRLDDIHIDEEIVLKKLRKIKNK